MKPGKVMLLALRDIAIGVALFLVVSRVGFWGLFLFSSGDVLRQNLLALVMATVMLGALILSPLIPIGFIINSTVRMVQYSDELQQRIFLYAIGFAAAATGLLTFAYGLLEFNGYPPLGMLNIISFMFILLFASLLYFKWRFR